LPYYARLAATLSQYFKDVGSHLLELLEKEFNYEMNKKDQKNIETKVRNIRFLGELVKFGICPTTTIFKVHVQFLHLIHSFQMLRRLLEEFTHHNIDLAANLLETCGRMLYRRPDTHILADSLVTIRSYFFVFLFLTLVSVE